MTEDQMKILKLMSEMTGHVDMNEFAAKTGLTSSEIMQNMQALAKAGLLKKVGSGFTLTQKGKGAVKAAMALPADKRFHFYFAFGQPMGVSVGSVQEFYVWAVKVSVASLEFHVERGDFENWFRTAIGDADVADDFAKMKKTGLKGDDLRKAIVKALEAQYPLKV